MFVGGQPTLGHLKTCSLLCFDCVRRCEGHDRKDEGCKNEPLDSDLKIIEGQVHYRSFPHPLTFLISNQE